MKYSVKPILWEYNPNEHGQFPIYVRITIAGNRSYTSTGHFIAAKFWNEKDEVVRESHSQAPDINLDVAGKRQRINKIILDLQHEGAVFTASQVKRLFESQSTVDLKNVFAFLEDFKEEVSSKRESGTLVNYDKHFNILKEFNGGGNLLFSEIDHRYLAKFEKFLRVEKKYNGNYVFTIFKDLRTICNAALKRGAAKNYPFKAYEFPEYNAPEKEYLTESELVRWEQYADTCQEPGLRQAAIWLLFGCYSGMRVSDWYRFNIEKHVYNDRIRIFADKNDGYVPVPISAPLARNLVRMKQYPLTLNEIVVNRYLKVIAAHKDVRVNKKVSTHTGRHTFAVTICLDNGVSSETAAELMGITLRTFVENYSQVTEDKIWRETERAWNKLV